MFEHTHTHTHRYIYMIAYEPTILTHQSGYPPNIGFGDLQWCNVLNYMNLEGTLYP
jgi:hypothetical protein